MGVEKENWPASVGIFTGILAKETVIGTLSSLYSQKAAAIAEENMAGVDAEDIQTDGDFDFWGGVLAAFATIPQNLSGIGSSLGDPLGIGMVSGDQEAVAEEVGADTGVYAGLRANFTGGPLQAYAYLLFVLLYLPCVAAFGAMTREMGLKYTLIATAYISITSWTVATLFYQISLGHNISWIIFCVLLFAAMIIVLKALGRQVKDEAISPSAKAVEA
jgi:ferrous iron transport protein B